MPNTPDTPSLALGPMLAQALDRSLDTSLDSLHALRKAVRIYTRNQKRRGETLDSVMRGVSSVLMEIEDDRTNGTPDSMNRDPDLARQLRAWCGHDYNEK